MNTKTILFSLIAMLAITAIVFQSCKKEKEDDEPENEPINEIYFEQAYPDIEGDTVSIAFDGDTIVCTFINGYYVYQGDMIIVPDPHSSIRGAGISATSKRWPNSIVYYTINNNLLNSNRVTKAIEHWENETDIIFIVRTNEENYIDFVDGGTGSSSNVGMIGGKQEIRISEQAKKGTVIHEIGHAIGLYHEHSKKNRDDYIIIKWANIKPWLIFNFFKERKSLITEGFDFESIMLYDSYAGSWNDKPTIVKLDGSRYVAQRDNLSLEDIEMINIMYSGTFTDPRDGQTYATIDIGSQTWFAENLNYETEDSWWYNNRSDNGDIYGRLYNWEAALTACPSGWHLPSDEEWKTMEMALGMSQSQADDIGYRGTDEGEKMKSTSGWHQNGNGTNSSGFNSLPGGERFPVSGTFVRLSLRGIWWTSTEYSDAKMWFRYTDNQNNQVNRAFYDKPYSISVRCLKD